jgi:hypothetical protein
MFFGQLIARIMQEIINPLIVLVFLIAVAAFGWGMVRYFAAGQGSDQRVHDAKKIMWWGVIGMFVLASMWGIVFLLCDFFGTCQPRGFVPQGFSGAGPAPGEMSCFGTVVHNKSECLQCYSRSSCDAAFP